MALEEPRQEDILITQDGLGFGMETGLMKLINMLGALSIDYRQSRWFGSNFSVRFSSSGSGCG